MVFESILEVVVRTIIIFLITYALMRLRGNRQLAQLSVFDLVIIIGLGSAVGDVMIYSEEVVPLINSITAISTLVLLVLLIENLIAVLPARALKILEGERVILIKNGKIDYAALRRVNLHEEELKSKLRQQNIHSYSKVREARLETDGTITITKIKNGNKKKT